MYAKKIWAFSLFLVLSAHLYCQIVGLGGQYVQRSHGQFFISAAYPTFYESNALKLFNLSGLEYTTPGSARLSGLQIKPIQLSSYLSDRIFYESPVVVTVGVDAGYLFNFSKGYKSTVVLTPNFYIDYKIFFLKGGYEIDALHGHHQYFIRAGIGFVLGTMKHFRVRNP